MRLKVVTFVTFFCGKMVMSRDGHKILLLTYLPGRAPKGAFSVGKKGKRHMAAGLYLSRKWKKKREKILRLDGYRDRVTAMYGKIKPANIVHHIYPAREYPEYAFEDWNLISVSMETHNMLENRNTGELTQLGRWLQRRTKPGEDWRKRK